MLEACGFHPHDVIYVPVSGKANLNLMKPCPEEFPWYGGLHLMATLDDIGPPPRNKLKELPLRMSVLKVSSDRTSVPVGLVKTGVLSMGQKVRFCPSGLVAEVWTIERYGHRVEQAYPGDVVEFDVGEINLDMIDVGEVICDWKKKPCKLVSKFEAMVTILVYPGEI